MSNFITTSRKYRPSLFNEVVGQHNITTVLKNSIKSNHISHAYLFCGPKGVGKTTCARILAKTINCKKITEDTEPCGSCDSCQQSNTLDIYELDAASNNSVEDIRSLVEQVRYSPQSGKYKVYIIDEVHMLSNAAFNAFLKTLEEPPNYVVFILATTEKHKVLPTIISRCQIFDFKKILPEEIADQLETIAKQENITYDKEALHLISQKSDGSLRDALSMFDLIAAFSSYQQVSYQDTIENLYILDYNYYLNITDAIQQNKVAEVLKIYDQIFNLGFDDQNFIIGLSEHFRDLLMCKNKLTLPLVKHTGQILENYIKQAQKISSDELFNFINISNECIINYKAAINQRLHVEIALINMAYDREKSEKIAKTQETVIEKPQNLEQKIEKNSIKPNEMVVQPKYTPLEQKTIQLPSLTSLREEAKKKTIPTLKKPITKAPDTETLKNFWKEYINQISTLENTPPPYLIEINDIKLEEEVITIHVDNIIKKNFITNMQRAITDFLCKKLNMQSIRLQIEAIDTIKNTKPYTNQDKFEYISKKYPDLLELKEKLGLEI
jgi:DNA polymerase-3 subunit gamma/tau